MFEELNQHRAAVAEQIQKACEIGFTGGELEKAHKVGDVHPNGKWVWTQLPSGRYDWRVIKRTSGGSAPAAPATAQKTAQSDKKEEEVKGFVNILKQKPNERHLELMDVDELKRFKDVANKCWLDDENLNRSTRLQCKEWRDLAKKELASKDEEERARQQENEYRKQHPNSVTKNSDIQQQASKEKEETKKANKKPSVKYGEMKLAAADKALVGKKITVNGKEAVIYDIGKWSSGNLFAKIVAGDDFINNSSFVDLSDIDAGKMEIRGMKEGYFGKPGDEVTVELSDEEPKRETITKESLKEFLDYLTKNISKKGTEEFTNRVRKFLSIVPRKYRGSSSNYYNEAATAAKRLLAEFK